MENYRKDLLVQAELPRVYEALTTPDGLKNWWTTDCEVEAQVGGTAMFRFDSAYVYMRIEVLNTNNEVIWKCIGQHFEIAGSPKTDEWVGTRIHFTLTQNTDQTTTVSFVHEGLTPNMTSYKISSEGWDYFLESLQSYLQTGKGHPYEVKRQLS